MQIPFKAIKLLQDRTENLEKEIGGDPSQASFLNGYKTLSQDMKDFYWFYWVDYNIDNLKKNYDTSDANVFESICKRLYQEIIDSTEAEGGSIEI